MVVIASIVSNHQSVDLQEMRYVVAVAEEGSFTKAAARCFVAQSALSHGVKRLESELGVGLFSRTSRRVALTAAGAAFLPHARTSLQAAERAASEAAAAAGQINGRLRVGVIPTVTAINMPAALRTFRRAYPGVHIALQVSGSDELEVAISRGDLDVAVLGLPENREPRGVAWRHQGIDRLVAVLGRDHPLADRPELWLNDLSHETFADFPVGTPARAESDQAFEAAGIPREVAFESMAIELTVELIRENLAIALLPSRYVPHESRLVRLPVVDGPSRSEYLAWSDFNPSPAALAFLALNGVAGSANQGAQR